MKYIDISRTISHGMKRYPTDPSVEIISFKSIDRGDSCNLNKLVMGSHTGTHIDAPRHILKKGRGVDVVKFENLICDVRVLDVKRGLNRSLFNRLNMKVTPGVVLKNARTGLTAEIAGMLVKKGVKVVGIDEMSIEKGHDRSHPVHRLLLGGGVIVIENLDLRKARPGCYKLLCLPLKIKNGDGAPARAILMHD